MTELTAKKLFNTLYKALDNNGFKEQVTTKFTFENLKRRTAKLSDAYTYMYQIITDLSSNKTWQNPSKKTLPRQG